MEWLKQRAWVFDAAWLVLWIAASSAWCLAASARLGATFDEPLYLQLGLEGWRQGSAAGLLHVGTMPLPVDVATFPLYAWESWRGIELDPFRELDLILPAARAANLAFWWLLLVYAWLSARALGGPWAGRLAVPLLACEPSLLAHASLATTDIALCACLLALGHHHAVGRRAGWFRRLALPAFWLAAAVLAKASGLVFGPMILGVVELTCWLRETPRAAGWLPALRDAWRERWRCTARDLAWIAGAAAVMVFAYCGCDWAPQPSFVAWAREQPDGPFGRSMVWLADNLRIFSNAGEGLVRQIKHNMKSHKGAYLLGEVAPTAFWYYFPVALSIKLTLTLLALPLLAALARPRALANWACLAALALLLFSFNCRVQIGIRLVLPLVVLAVVGVAAGVAAVGGEPGSWRRPVLAGAALLGVAWSAWSAWSVFPNALCYVNEAWGGTEQGYRLLSDSNYDWGQGLKELAQWRQLHGGRELDIWYFGPNAAVHHAPGRIAPIHVEPASDAGELLDRIRSPLVAVSTTMLHGVPMNEPHRLAIEFFRSRIPVDRTTTYFIYDLTKEKAERPATVSPRGRPRKR